MNASTLAMIYSTGALMTLGMTLLVVLACLGVALYCWGRKISARAAWLFCIAWGGFLLVSIVDFGGRYVLARTGSVSLMEWLSVTLEVVNIGFGVLAAVAMFLFKPQAAAMPSGKEGTRG